jgi:hypothetical protein
MRTLRALGAALAKGFSEWQTLLVLWCLTFLSAAIAVLPDLGTLIKFYGHAPLAEGKPLLSVELLLGMKQAFSSGQAPLASLALLLPPGGTLAALPVALLVALPLTLFLTGGVVWRAWTVDGFRLTEFIAECARSFGRVVRTLLWSLPLLALTGGLATASAALLHSLHRDSLFTVPRAFWILARPLTGWAVAHLALVGGLWALWRMTLDTARVLSLVEELRQTRKAVWRAFRLVVASPGAWLAYAFLGGAEVCAVLLVMRVHASLPEGNTAWALLALLVAQGVVLVRAGFQVSTTAFAADLVRRTHAAVAPAPVASSAGVWPAGLAPTPAVTAAAPAAGEPATAEGEPFELLASKPPSRSDSTAEMPMVDADLVEEEPPPGGGTGTR